MDEMRMMEMVSTRREDISTERDIPLEDAEYPNMFRIAFLTYDSNTSTRNEITER